jgi:uncharacterized membrane-anchored protein YitT (DUF2179 family)
MDNQNKIWRAVKDYFLVTLGITLYVTGWAVFLVPNNLVGGGVSGIASMIQYATGIKMGYSYFVINAILLIIGFCVLGPDFGVKTVYAIIVASIGLNLLQAVIPMSIIKPLAIDNGKMICTTIGGLMTGTGIGIAMQGGGSSGGTDIIALIVSKYRNISTGTLILWMDVAIILMSLLIPSYTADGTLLPFSEKVSTVVFGLVLVTVNGFVIDLYLNGTRQSVQVFVMSHRYEEIADKVSKDMHRGVTLLQAKGWYTKEASQVLMIITRKTDLKVLLRYIKSIDPDAFLSVGSVSEVYGNGFDNIKINAEKSKKS